MNVFDLVASLTLDTSSYDSALAQARNSASLSGNDISRGLGSVGRAATLVGGVIVGNAAIGVKAAADFESAFTGAMKTINFEAGTSQEEIDLFFDNLYAGILNLSRRLPQTAEEIAGVVEVAGQLGINNADILEFSEVMLGLGSATNLSADEAAAALARFANVTKMNPEDFDKLGSTIVALGNNTATTESEIVFFMQNLANLSNVAGLSEADIAALAATMSATGARAEITRTTFENFALSINSAVADSGEKLNTLARVSGMTAEEFTNTWRGDPMTALTSFISGLDELNYEENEQIEVLKSLGVKQTLRQQLLLRAAGAHEQLAESVEMANEAYKENGETLEEYNDLQIEVAKRNETLESRWDMFKNSLKEVTIDVGEALVPALKDFLEALTPIINNIAEFVKEHPDFVKRIAEIGLALVGLGTATSGVQHIIDLFSTFSSQTALVVMGILALVTVLGTLAMMYRGELGNFFSQLSLYFDNVRLGIEQVRLIIENLDWGAFGAFLGTSLILGIAGAINSGIGMITDAINNVIREINIDLPFLQWSGEEWLSSLNGGKGIVLGKINTEGLEESVETYRSQLYNGKENGEEVQKKLDELNAKKDENDRKLAEGSWWSTGDQSSFEQRLYTAKGEMITAATEWLGLGDLTDDVGKIFGLGHIESATESAREFTSAIQEAAGAVAGNDENGSESLTTGLQTLYEQLPETASAVGPLVTTFDDTLPTAVDTVKNVLSGEDGLLFSLNEFPLITSGVQASADGVSVSFSGLEGSISSSNDASKDLATESGEVTGALGDIGGAASSAAGEFANLANQIGGVIEQLNKFPNGRFSTFGLPEMDKRASGGIVNANQAYLVGEEGPEVYVPSRSGSIIPNGALSGLGQTINVSVRFDGDVIGDADSISRYVSKACEEAIKEAVYAAA